MAFTHLLYCFLNSFLDVREGSQKGANESSLASTTAKKRQQTSEEGNYAVYSAVSLVSSKLARSLHMLQVRNFAFTKKSLGTV